jgi:hypothetical protein
MAKEAFKFYSATEVKEKLDYYRKQNGRIIQDPNMMDPDMAAFTKEQRNDMAFHSYAINLACSRKYPNQSPRRKALRKLVCDEYHEDLIKIRYLSINQQQKIIDYMPSEKEIEFIANNFAPSEIAKQSKNS